MGFPHYHGVGLSTEEVLQRQRKRRLRARRLQNTTNIDQEFLMGGNATFVGQPTPDTELLDNLRSAAFAGATSKAAYLDALKNSNDLGLQSTTNVIVHESGSGFSLTPTERISPSAYSDDNGNGRGFNSYIIAAMAAVSFIVIGSALFLYSRKRMRDGKEEDMLSLHSDEASDSVLLKGDLVGCSDSIDSHDSAIKVPSEHDIQPVPISLIRDSRTMERAMVRASRNRSVIEKANERVERKSILMNEDHEEDSKTISFAEIIANSLSRSPRVSSHLPLEPLDHQYAALLALPVALPIWIQRAPTAYRACRLTLMMVKKEELAPAQTRLFRGKQIPVAKQQRKIDVLNWTRAALLKGKTVPVPLFAVPQMALHLKH